MWWENATEEFLDVINVKREHVTVSSEIKSNISEFF